MSAPTQNDAAKTIGEFAQQLFEKHGVCLEAVQIAWVQFHALGEKPRCVVDYVRVELKKPGGTA